MEDPQQEIGSLTGEGDIRFRKLVQKTATPGEYQISIAVQGKPVTTSTTVENDICAVVVFDRSNSM